MVRKDEEKTRAIELRKQGYSLNHISLDLKVAKSSVSTWVRGIKLTWEQKKNLCDKIQNNREKFEAERYAVQNRLKYLDLRKKYQDDGREKAKEKQWLHTVGCMLYWAEGSKSKNEMGISNSDLFLLKLFVRFLRESYKITDDKITVSVHVHLNNGLTKEKIEEYWLNGLDLPKSSLRKTIANSYSHFSQMKKVGKLPYGTCHVRVCSTKLVQNIYGAIQEYGNFERTAWLF